MHAFYKIHFILVFINIRSCLDCHNNNFFSRECIFFLSSERPMSLRLLFSYCDKKWVGLVQFVYNQYHCLGIVNANHSPYYCYSYVDCYVLPFYAMHTKKVTVTVVFFLSLTIHTTRRKASRKLS